jgi:hypothetical protein
MHIRRWPWVERLLQESLPTARLVGLERWENRLQFRDYLTTSKNLQVKRKDDGGANEQWMWHGTSKIDPKGVLRHEAGMDPRFSSRGFYGTGLYLAEKACYSGGTGSQYAFCPNYPDTSVRQLILARAAVGKTYDYGTTVNKDTRALQKPPNESAGVLFDSVLAGPHRPAQSGPGPDDSKMVIFYTLSQVQLTELLVISLLKGLVILTKTRYHFSEIGDGAYWKYYSPMCCILSLPPLSKHVFSLPHCDWMFNAFPLLSPMLFSAGVSRVYCFLCTLKKLVDASLHLAIGAASTQPPHSSNSSSKLSDSSSSSSIK